MHKESNTGETITKRSSSQAQKPSPNSDLKNYRTKISEDGRIQVNKKAYVFRISILIIVAFFPVYRLYQGTWFNDTWEWGDGTGWV